MHDNNIETKSESLKSKVERFAKLDVNECYQCGKCTAGCPLREEMDIMPNQIIRMLQMEYPGYEDEILRSYSIWLCLACETCYSRCPQEIQISSVMDVLRQESIRLNKVNPKAKDILSFHKSFLNEVARNGKLNEVGLTVEYKLRSLNIIQDIANAPSMLLKGKLGIIPHKVNNTREIRNLFKKTEK
jgi:heterodisulfide reductase subunit C